LTPRDRLRGREKNWQRKKPWPPGTLPAKWSRLLPKRGCVSQHRGGTLVIGVEDNGNVYGLADDIVSAAARAAMVSSSG